MDRRTFLGGSLALSATTFAGTLPELPLKFGHRQANMGVHPGEEVFALARRIRGLSGVELQVMWKGQDLTQRETALQYKRGANRWAVEVPSLAGIWKPGESVYDRPIAERAIAGSVRAAEWIGASVILVALYKKNCPDMQDEKSYAPLVSLFQKMGEQARGSGVVLGLETSLAPADDRKLIHLIAHSSVKTYFDATNVETDHPGQAIAGIGILGADIVQCHLKNENPRLDQKPAKVDWAVACRRLQQVGFRGWHVFETRHADTEACVRDTEANIAFVRRTLSSNSPAAF
ncbi:MAG: hypothetical protein JSS87_05050 [Acidobacteria bacterium]|nr:hypothetical protein [Acidobacteriota bacterium]